VDEAAAVIPEPAPGWVVLASADAPRSRRERPVRFRRVVLQLAIAVGVVVALVAVVGSIVSRRTAEQQGVHDAAQMTDVLAQSAVQPALTDALLTDQAAAERVLAPIVDEQVKIGSVVRVKIWTPTGRILYSDEKRLIGRAFALDDEARSSLQTPSTQASVTDLSRPENVYERSRGRLLEVYRPVWTPAGKPLLFEAYYPYSVVTSRANDLWRGFSGILLSSLAAVFVLLLPVAWALVGRTRRAQQAREQLMQRALDASDAERRRIAATLHDGAVQQLAATSFAVAGAAERAEAAGDTMQAERLRDTAATVRSTLGSMRSLLVDIYPPSLRSAGLAAALRDLTTSVAGHDVEVTLDVDDELAEQPTAEQQEAIFRVAQESLRNAVKHARPSRVDMSLIRHDNAARLEITDDGTGFPASSAGSPTGHFGLTLMTDVAERIGAGLAIASAPGAGTRVRMDVTLS
jgi:two-component system NarL family sensor kinase